MLVHVQHIALGVADGDSNVVQSFKILIHGVRFKV
jgi:hypothetical protein